MPPVVIAAGIGAAAQVIGAVTQNRSNNSAARMEQESADEALNFERDRFKYDRAQYANYQQRLSPYANAGTRAVGQLSQSTSQPLPTVTNGNGPMVTLRSPDGTTREVPATQADFYLSRGAQRV